MCAGDVHHVEHRGGHGQGPQGHGRREGGHHTLYLHSLSVSLKGHHVHQEHQCLRSHVHLIQAWTVGGRPSRSRDVPLRRAYTAMSHMVLVVQISKVMDQFEKQFEDLDVRYDISPLSFGCPCSHHWSPLSLGSRQIATPI